MKYNENLLYDSLQDNGIEIPKNINLSGFSRWGKNSRYWAVMLDQYNWAFGDFSTGFRGFAFQNNRTEKTPQQMARLQKILQEKRELEHQRIENKQNNTAKIANILWDFMSPDEPTHQYLTRKQISAHGARLDIANKNIKIPLYDTNNKIWNLQSISENGDKRFMAGGKKKGCFYPIGKVTETTPIVIVEGFATGASVYEATLLPVFVSFDAGNLEHVAEAVIKKYPKHKVIIASDNDWEKDTNTGRFYALNVAQKFALTAIIPCITTKGLSDFNDIHCAFGLNNVREQFKKGKII